MNRRSFIAPLLLATFTWGQPAATTQPAPTTQVVPLQNQVPLSKIVPDGKPHAFTYHDRQFFIDKEPTVLIAGEMHFGRILPEDFELRVKQAKAMGLNALSFYLFWNLSEPEEGTFDFTGMNDVRRMLRICQDNGMWVILRPGPYCCAEVEYGGIPYWTLNSPEVRIRTNDPKYVEWSRNYINRVFKEVADFQSTRGGPLLMVQMENEYAGAAGGNFDYMHSLKKIFEEAGFEIPLFACDPFLGRGPNPYGDDVLRGRNGINSEQSYQQTLPALGDQPVYVPELYTAWFSGWGQPIAKRFASVGGVVNSTNVLLNHEASFCYYMFFGGTNWNYNTGCNQFMPVQTSYDYTAPIDEAGRTTEKYHALRRTLASRLQIEPPPVPPEPIVETIPPITLAPATALVDTLPVTPTSTTDKPAPMESLHQAYGFVLYRNTFPRGIKGKLELRRVQDYAVTMINGKTVGQTFMGYGPESATIPLDESGPVTLDILVHNLGRISVPTNAGTSSRAHKGIMGGVYLDGAEVNGWDNYSLPLASPPTLSGDAKTIAGPTFYRGAFDLEKPVGTFLDLRNFRFGIVWVNGHNLGRYWEHGGQRSLYLSPHFLKAGSNEIVVLELRSPKGPPVIDSSTHMIEEPPELFAYTLTPGRTASSSPTTRPSVQR